MTTDLPDWMFEKTPNVPPRPLVGFTEQQRTEQNFCPRCGKRTKDLTTIHTCTPPVAQQESVADDFFRMIADRNPKPFSPPQRTWVGLTDEEICMFSMWLDSKPDATVFTAIEARLKELNT